MIHRTIGAATAAFLLLCAAAATADADVIQTRDGQWWPKSIQKDMEGQDAPSDEVLRKSGKNNLDLGYDSVELKGQKFSPSDILQIFSTTAYENAAFKNGELQGASAYWGEAAESFGDAAENLKGAGKEIALHYRVRCFANLNDAAKAFDALQQLLDAFPKTYFYANVQDMKARILVNRKDRKGAEAALDKVIAAPGMNSRDYFEAKLAKIYLFKFKTAGKDKKRYAAARADYQRVVREIEARSAESAARAQWLKGKVGIGKCFVYEEDFVKARPFFDQVISDKTSLEDKAVLAQAYTGRGDVKYAAIKKELAGGNVPEDQLTRVTEALIDASLDYVRVAKFYVENAGDDLFGATIGAARVWATQFTINGENDCGLAQRAAKYFFAAHRLLPRGETKRLLTSEVKRFLAKRDEACKADEPAK